MSSSLVGEGERSRLVHQFTLLPSFSSYIFISFVKVNESFPKKSYYSKQGASDQKHDKDFARGECNFYLAGRQQQKKKKKKRRTNKPAGGGEGVRKERREEREKELIIIIEMA